VTTADVPGTGTFLVWGTVANLALADGETRAFDSDHVDNAVMMNADVEPDNNFTLLKKKKGNSNGKVIRLFVAVPNPGTLTAPNKGTLKRPKAARYVRRRSVTASGPGVVGFNLRLKKTARTVLSRDGELRFSLPITYTPSFGKTAARVAKVSLTL
jgi:hypothetical protein